MGHDLTLIKNSYDVEGAGIVDLGQLATKHLGIAVGSRSLGGLSETLPSTTFQGQQHSDWELGEGSDARTGVYCGGPSTGQQCIFLVCRRLGLCRSQVRGLLRLYCTPRRSPWYRHFSSYVFFG